VQFITKLVTNFRQPLSVGPVEQSEIAQVGYGKSFAVPFIYTAFQKFLQFLKTIFVISVKKYNYFINFFHFWLTGFWRSFL